MEKPTTTSVSGTLHRIVFRNDETGFSILRVTVEGRTDPITVVGITSAGEGEFIVCDGEWIVDPSYGKQLKATHIVANLPMTEEGIVKYLSSGKIKGVGETIAKNIVKQFGLKTFEVLDANIDSLIDVPKIGPGKLKKIKDSWETEHAVRQVTVFLQSHGVSAALAHRINKEYGGRAIEVIQHNPWRLARDVRGIGFLMADQIAMRLGKEKTAPERLSAGLSYKLFEAMSGGHCGLDSFELVKRAAEALDVPQDAVFSAFNTELKSERPAFVKEGLNVWVPHLYDMETKIAAFIRGLADAKPIWNDIDAEESIKWVEFETNASLADQQQEALRQAIKSRIMVITGGPGCGKTFLLNSILKVMRRAKVKILLAAPTGKAAVRMTESTGLPASTMHRLMKLGREGDAEPEKLDCDLLVLDESSMIDVPLFFQALRRLPDHASLLMVGDSDQLPSVGPGAVLGDLISSGRIPVVRLNKVFRQAEGSFIIKNAHRVNSGLMPEKAGADGDFFFIKEENADNIPAIIEELVSSRLPAKYGYDPVKDIQVLCPSRRSPTGVIEVNRRLQARLNPTPAAAHTRLDTRYGVGDKVMQTVNNYEKVVFNGDMGVIERIDEDETTAHVRFPHDLISYDFTELDELVLAYSFTIHKSQGSDFPAVVIPVTTQHYMMLQRNLVYTGITRARKLCVIVGQERALEMAIGNVKATARNTRLEFLLKRDL